MQIVKLDAEMLSHTPSPELLIERAGRTCYKSEDRITSFSSAAFVEMIIKSGHHSVLEHASATMLLTVDRGVSHELVRHRLASFSQESTRYCNYSSGKFCHSITVVRPLEICEGTPNYRRWLKAMEEAEASYIGFTRDRGCAPGVARHVLPISLKTDIVITANLREWLHILDLRLDVRAHTHIRYVMTKVFVLLFSIAPTVFSIRENQYVDAVNDLTNMGVYE